MRKISQNKSEKTQTMRPIGNYMKKSMMPKKISVSVEFTDGYQQRFTTAILKIYEKRTKQGKQFSESKNNKSA